MRREPDASFPRVVELERNLGNQTGTRLCHVRWCLGEFTKNIKNADLNASIIWKSCHDCIATISNVSILSHEKISDPESIQWMDVCEKISRLPGLTPQFLYVLVEASIACDCLVHSFIDTSLLEFLFRQIRPEADSDIIEAVFSLLVDCILVDNPFAPVVLTNVFCNPFVRHGQILQVYEFIVIVLERNFICLSEDQKQQLVEILERSFDNMDEINIEHSQMILTALRKLTISTNNLCSSVCSIMTIIYKRCPMLFDPGYDSLFQNYIDVIRVLLRNGIPVESIDHLIPWNVIAERLIHREDLCESVFDLLEDLADVYPRYLVENIGQSTYTIEHIFNILYDRILSSVTYEKRGLLHIIYIVARHPRLQEYIVGMDMLPLISLMADMCAIFPDLLTQAGCIIDVLCPDNDMKISMKEEFQQLIDDIEHDNKGN